MRPRRSFETLGALVRNTAVRALGAWLCYARGMRVWFASVFVLVACSRPQAAAPRSLQLRAEVLPSSVPSVGDGSRVSGTRGEALVPSAVRVGRRFGNAIAADVPQARLAEIVQSPQRFVGRPVRVEGTVVAVCQHMGCWMELRDEVTQAHVRMHGHSFFVPRDIQGKRAAVQATVVTAHAPTECDQEAQRQTGRVAQVELDATGVEVFDEPSTAL